VRGGFAFWATVCLGSFLKIIEVRMQAKFWVTFSQKNNALFLP
jgi:hypothetical protein